MGFRLVLELGGLGVLSSVLGSLLKRAGKETEAKTIATLAQVIGVGVVVSLLAELLDTMKTLGA